jgi:hypothetical protein
MPKKVDLKAKEKKQKIIAGVGAVVLLGLLAFQAPRTMKMLNQSSAPPPPAAPSSTLISSRRPRPDSSRRSAGFGARTRSSSR